jgi:hypothetical protein
VVVITPEEQEELRQEKHSWVQGKEIVTLDAIDWGNPPSDDAVVLAPTPIRKHRRTFKDKRFTKVQGQTITIDRHSKPRQPMYFASWKRRQWDFIKVMAKAYEEEKTAVNRSE